MSGLASCSICDAHLGVGEFRLIGDTRVCPDCALQAVLVKAWTEGLERRTGRAVDLPDRVLP